MKSIWIVLGRDSEFGKSHVVEHLIARTVSWEVQEHPINESKVQPLTDFSNIYRIRDVIEQAEESEDE